MIRAFTKKREGPASDALVVTTDTFPPGAPLITNITCHGASEIQLEWRRPGSGDGEGSLLASSSRNAPIKFYKIKLRVRGGRDAVAARAWTASEDPASFMPRDTEIHVEVMNDTVRNVAFLPNLTSGAIYDLSVSAFVASHAHPGVTYEGPSSIARRVLVGRECDPMLQAFSKVPYIFEYNAGIVAGVVSTATSLVLIALLLLICRWASRICASSTYIMKAGLINSALQTSQAPLRVPGADAEGAASPPAAAERSCE